MVRPTKMQNNPEEFEHVSGLPLLKAQRQPCHHPVMDVDQGGFEAKNVGGFDLDLWNQQRAQGASSVNEAIENLFCGGTLSYDPMPPSREGHRGKLWDPRRFHRPDGPNWYDEYMFYWRRLDKDDADVWYGVPRVSFRVTERPVPVLRANSCEF